MPPPVVLHKLALTPSPACALMSTSICPELSRNTSSEKGAYFPPIANNSARGSIALKV